MPKSNMPAYRKKKSRKRPLRRRNVKKQKRFTKKAARRYVSPRAMAIQRADFCPQTKMIEFVMDETYYLVPNAVDKASNSHGISLQLGTPFSPYAVFQGNKPFWGSNDDSKNARLSGITTAYEDWDMPGTGRWLGYHPALYESGIVVGFDVEVRAEQATRSVTQDTGTPVPDMVRSIAMCGRISKNDGKFDNTTTSAATLAHWQNSRKVRQVNMTVTTGSDGTMSGPAKNNAQQAYLRFKGSAKKCFGFKDYGDVRDKYGIIGSRDFDEASQTGPEEQPYLHLGFFDRFQSIENSASGTLPHTPPYVMPDMVVRVKHKIAVLLSRPNNRVNLDAGDAMDGGDN